MNTAPVRPAGLTDPSYLRWHQHLTTLLAEARPDLDGEFHAHILLAAFNADLVRRMAPHGDHRRLATTLRDLASALLHAPPRQGTEATL